jgi:hypothetical protein
MRCLFRPLEETFCPSTLTVDALRFLLVLYKIFFAVSVSIMKLRRMRWAGHVARMGEKRNVYRLLVGKSEGKRPLGRPRHR